MSKNLVAIADWLTYKKRKQLTLAALIAPRAKTRIYPMARPTCNTTVTVPR